MIFSGSIRAVAFALMFAAGSGVWIKTFGQTPTKSDVTSDHQHRFNALVVPFLNDHCLGCHGEDEPEAKLDLTGFDSVADIAREYRVWDILIDRIVKGEMPPSNAGSHPTAERIREIEEWFHEVRDQEAQRTAGDPGIVFVRRLSNAEYNYTIRDLTGFDIRPTETFPIDPANESGFDNSGESLAMSPALFNKYVKAAREVAEHAVLTPSGISFSPHPTVTPTDRDKYCVKRIVTFYQQQPTDYADYLYSAWRFRHREQLGRVNASIDEFADENQVSAKYLKTLWLLLQDDSMRIGPVGELHERWMALPNDLTDAAKARMECENIRDFIVRLRNKLIFSFPDIQVEGGHRGSQPFVLWKNRQYVKHRRKYNPDAIIRRDLGDQSAREDKRPTASDRDRSLLTLPDGEQAKKRFLKSLERFCAVFPDAFYVSERGRDYVDDNRKQDGEKGRLLSAGFHSMMGYFRDDQPLYDMILDAESQKEIDALWEELDFVTLAPERQYAGFLWFERTDSKYMRDPQFDFARPENKQSLSKDMIQQLAKLYREKAQSSGGGDVELDAIDHYFRDINSQIRWVETARISAEPGHLQAVLAFAEKAFRRPMTDTEKEDWTEYYQQLRSDSGLSHEESIQDLIVSILLSPHFFYRLDLAAEEEELQPLNEYEIASRLSYFLWSSMPDEELMATATTGDILKPEILIEQMHRMLDDDRCRGLAVEFAGNWLGFRRFEQHNGVDRNRFPQFDDDLRSAMYEEPVRFFVDVFKKNRCVLDLLYGEDTFVNADLAIHYRMPIQVDEGEWVHVENALPYDRGGILPMAIFLTQNSPGLRTSPVKRGYWIIRNLLGERIPPPPPDVPELPGDESDLGNLTLRQTLARHREHQACAGCHERIDSVGIALEGFGPIGEKRTTDLGGRPVDVSARFPSVQTKAAGVQTKAAGVQTKAAGVQAEATGVDGLRDYLKDHRENEFIDNFCRKLLSFALGRSLLLSDEVLLAKMKKRLTSDGGTFRSVVESIVLSPQFLNKRGRATVVSSQSGAHNQIANEEPRSNERR